jgi:hypothetical protein
MKETKYFKCIGLEERQCPYWASLITVGTIYEGYIHRSNKYILCIEIAAQEVWVDTDQFVEVDELHKSTVKIRIKKKPLINIIIDGEWSPVSIDRKAQIKEELSKPLIKAEEVNKLLDELNKLK